MKVLVFYDKSAPKYLRLLMPVHLMGVDVTVKWVPEEQDFEGVDIVFFNRAITTVTLSQMLEWRERFGFKLICDLDDHWVLGKDHLLYDTYAHYGIGEIIATYIAVSDVVTVTHERLYADAVQLNPNVHILPNAIAHYDQFAISRVPDDKVRLFWAGGVTHRKDLAILAGPARRISSDKVKWVLGGYVKDNEEWQAMASTFTNGGRFNHTVFESLGVHEYYKLYSQCDVSLIPLVDNRFNTFKSNLKILEAANVGAPVVVSRVHPYLGFPEGIVNYVDSQRDWYRHVTNLVNNRAWAAEQGERLREYVQEHYNFDKINEQRTQIFKHTIKQNYVHEIHAV